MASFIREILISFWHHRSVSIIVTSGSGMSPLLTSMLVLLCLLPHFLISSHLRLASQQCIIVKNRTMNQDSSCLTSLRVSSTSKEDLKVESRKCSLKHLSHASSRLKERDLFEPMKWIWLLILSMMEMCS